MTTMPKEKIIKKQDSAEDVEKDITYCEKLYSSIRDYLGYEEVESGGIVILPDLTPLSKNAIDALNYANTFIPKKVSRIKFPSAFIYISRGRNGKNRLKIECYNELELRCENGTMKSPFTASSKSKRWDNTYAKAPFFRVSIDGSGGAIRLNTSYDSVKTKTGYWPLTLTDIAYFFRWRASKSVPKILMIQNVLSALMHAWAENNPIWRDIEMDLKDGTSFASIPVKEIHAAKSKRDLVQSHYHRAGKRTNKDKIGQSIFFERALMLVNENEIQKLYFYDPVGYKITNSKMSIAWPLANAMHEHLIRVAGTDTFVRGGAEVKCDEKIFYDAVCAAIRLREKVTLSLKSPASYMAWHDDLLVRRRDLEEAKVTIPKNSRFRKLTLPDNCIHLKTKKALIEEGTFQRNCVATYANSVSRDYCSIWSMRISESERYTIEIVIDQKNRYKIRQMLGYGNRSCPDIYVREVRECIERQVPMRNPRKKK